MKFLGLEFAPFDVPLQRRLQTFTVFYMSTSFMFFGLLGTLLWVYLFFTPYYFLSLIYGTWLYYDWDTPERGGRLLRSSRGWTPWRYYTSYFPAKLVKTAELDPNKNYVIGFHPHGIMSAGCVSNFASDATGFADLFPGITPRCMTLAGQFMVPFHRESLLLLGFLSVSKNSINWLLSKEGKGNAVVIVVGGAAESLDARPGEAMLTLKNRKGFVRIAIKNGASLVPVFSFGENDVYDQVYNPVGSPLRTIQDKIRKCFGVAPPIFHGRGVFNYSMGFLPHRKPINTVVGKPIDLEKNENPSQELVDKVHQEYLQELKEIYDKYSKKYGNPERELIFV